MSIYKYKKLKIVISQFAGNKDTAQCKLTITFNKNKHVCQLDITKDSYEVFNTSIADIIIKTNIKQELEHVVQMATNQLLDPAKIYGIECHWIWNGDNANEIK